jgi:sn-glycerol 3-phosphate transport system substrate-binding protein
MFRRTATTIAFSLSLGATASAQTEIQWWHAMTGPLGDRLGEIAEGFNTSQKDFIVKPTNKGTYPETMNAAVAAFRAKQNPAIVQVFEVGTATMMGAKGAIYPVHELMKDNGLPFDSKNYLPAVTGYYTDTAGNMLSFPFNSSTPILYWNKAMFKQAGVDPDKAPKTWKDIEEISKKVVASGGKCGFTTQWPSWVLIENFSALHNAPIGTKANGFAGLDTEFKINSPLHVRHVTNLIKWQAEKIYQYGGRRGDADPKFFSGECAIHMGSSAARAAVIANAKTFDVGFGMLPYYDDVAGAPQNSIIGGATLWVLKGRPDAEYKGVAKFMAYLSTPEVQAKWHQATGYLPITPASYELSKTQGYYDKNPGADTSIKQMTLNPPTENSKGLRFGSFVQIRDVIEEELELAIGGKKPPQEALDTAVKRGNELLRAFEAANK